MSFKELKAQAQKLQASMPALQAADELTAYLLKDKNRPQLLALAKHFLASIQTKHEVLDPPAARRREGAHRRAGVRPLVPTLGQKRAALMARASTADAIFGHKLRGGTELGEIKIHELPAAVEAAAHDTIKFLNRGYEDAVDCFLLAGIVNRCDRSVDPMSLVRDAIKPSVAAEILERAKIKASEVIRDKSAKMARDLIALANA